jgi:hypothetical protein
MLAHCTNIVNKHIPNRDMQAIDKFVILDRNENNESPNAGGMYFLKREKNPAYVELYIEQILNGIPQFVPKFGMFFKYSIIRMILHEIGHHVNSQYAYEKDIDAWEKHSKIYTTRYLWKIYGLWMYIFLTLGSINNK